jgi:3-hydroxyacyl-CoA dehydrogenase
MKAASRSRAELNDLMRSRSIEHVVVLGANGAMGYASGALFTTAVPRVTFLARDKDKADRGLEIAVQTVRSSTVRRRVDTGSYETGFDAAVSSADLVFEALAEDFDVKRRMFERVDAVRRPDSIVASVTSGLSINALAEGRSESFRRHFLGLHFFNPPNVIVGAELVAGRETSPEVVEFVEAFARKRLGRVMVRVADTPGFAGNRVGFKVLNEVAQLAEEYGPVLVDRLIGPYTGRAMTPLATIDLVGWDVHRAIVDNVHKNAPDEAHASLRLPGFMSRLLAKGTCGHKSGGGFFKVDSGVELALHPETETYRPKASVVLPELGFIDRVARLHREGRYRDAMRAFLQAPGHWAAVARKVVAGYVSYAFHRAGEVTEGVAGIDDIMGFGVNWAPPSVLVDMIGAREIVAMIERAKLPVPDRLARAVSEGAPARFYVNPHANIGRFFVAG